MKYFAGTLSIVIGINLWFAPQISEHCPYNNPGRLIENLIWFSRPGVASVFTPSLGTVHECNTSAAVTISRIGEFIGRTTRLSVSSNRNVLVCCSSCGVIYESNSSFVKSEYSYLQYHWCPTAFSVNAGLWISSIRYRSRRDGMAMNTKMIAGAIVHVVSIICPSNINRLVCLFRIRVTIMYDTVMVIIDIIIST